MVDESAGQRRIPGYYTAVFFAFLIFSFLFRLWFITTLPLSGDEAYHWEWSRHLAFGYYDHPGLTAYLIRFFTWLFGRSTEFTVRLPALVMLTGTSWICFLLAMSVVRDRGESEDQAGRAGLLAGIQVLIIPIFAVFSCYISTDPPVIFFWALSLYLLYRAIWTEKWRAWIGGGFAFGLAMMSKFLAFPLVPAIFLFALISPADRKWFSRPQPYVAGVCALLAFSPFIWWNATHDWATFMFNFVYRQDDMGFEPWHMPEFIAGQALSLSPGIFAFAVFCLWLALHDWFRRRDRASLFLGLSSLLPLVYFFYVSFRRQVGIHWPAAGWLGAIVCVSCYLARDEAASVPSRREKLGKGAVILCAVMVVLMHLVAHIPSTWITASWRYWGDPDRINLNAANERYGWHELGQRVETVMGDMLKQDGRKVFVISGQYGLSAAVSFYTPGQVKAHLWAPQRVHGENYRFWDDFVSFKGWNAVYVTKDREDADGAMPMLRMHFGTTAEPDRLPICVDGKEVRSFYLIRCYDFDGVKPDFAAYEKREDFGSAQD